VVGAVNLERSEVESVLILKVTSSTPDQVLQRHVSADSLLWAVCRPTPALSYMAGPD
jgi:hypothetical protein